MSRLRCLLSIYSMPGHHSHLVKHRYCHEVMQIYTIYFFLTLTMLNILCTTLLPKFYPVNLQHSSYLHVYTIRVDNSVDPDQMALSETS